MPCSPRSCAHHFVESSPGWSASPGKPVPCVALTFGRPVQGRAGLCFCPGGGRGSRLVLLPTTTLLLSPKPKRDPTWPTSSDISISRGSLRSPPSPQTAHDYSGRSQASGLLCTIGIRVSVCGVVTLSRLGPQTEQPVVGTNETIRESERLSHFPKATQEPRHKLEPGAPRAPVSEQDGRLGCCHLLGPLLPSSLGRAPWQRGCWGASR